MNKTHKKAFQARRHIANETKTRKTQMFFALRVQDRYSGKQIVRTIEQRSYDMRRSYNTIYSQNVSQAVA